MRAVLLSVAVLATAWAGCGDDGGNGGEGGGSDGPLTLATFNTGLSPGFVPYASARSRPIADALAALEADVLCAQELVLPADVERVQAATAARWPEAILLEPAPGEEAVCTLAELAPLVDCALQACGELQSEALAECVVQTCTEELSAIGPDCAACLAGQLESDLEAVTEACTPEGGGVGYGGAFGVGLFAGARVAARDTLQLEASLARRGVVYALLEPAGGEPVHVFCTHLTPLFDRIPHPGGATWNQEQGRQVDALLEWVAQKVPAGERVAILGDLNTGPAGDGWAARAQTHYQRFLGAGFRNPFAEGATAACTWCGDNLLVDDDAEDGLIDHVLLRDFAGAPKARRLFTAPVELEVDGRLEAMHLSDHYGVAVTED